MNKIQVQYLIVLSIFLVFLFYLFFFTPFYSLFTKEKITHFVQNNEEYAILVFWIINFIAALFFIPLTLFWIIAGMLFGSVVGTILTATAATTAATLAFLLCRKYERLFDKLIFKNDKARRWKEKIEEKVEQNSFTIIFIIRVLPHPFMLFSYIAGFSKTIRVNVFILATFLAIVPISFSFVLLGDSLLNDVRIIILPIFLILLATQLPKIINKFSNIKL